jgi:wyosine [tRNA(Phe)-imidazoG37] synthetase (radical SAM superfamily)
MTLLPLQSGILYGPVNSRRLGKSLGVNLMPGSYKLCSFNCVYCHYGWTKKQTIDFSKYHEDLPSIDEVVTSIAQALKSSLEFDFLTFSGNGEPTLYPQFTELLEEVVRLRNIYKPKVNLALLSNSTGLVSEDVLLSLSKIDFAFLKLDAGTEEKFKAINRPARGVNFSEIIGSLCSAKKLYIQTILLEGNPSNVTEDALEAYFQKISLIQPEEVHIYSIDRPVPDRAIFLVSKDRLGEIADWGKKQTGIEFKPFYLQ